MNGFYDYIPEMLAYCEKHKPKKIFEYGCGLSTVLFSKLYPESRLISVETSLFWYLINKVVMILRGCRNAKLYYVPNINAFVRFAGRFPKQDLYFLDAPVDYEQRKRCLEILRELGGNIIAHDASHYIDTNRRTYIELNGGE